MSHLQRSGVAWMISGLFFFCDLALHLFSGLGQGYFILAGLMALCTLGAAASLPQLRLVAPGWRTWLSWIGYTLMSLGALLWLLAFALLYINPEAAFTQRLTPGGSLLLSVGMISFGSAVLASQRLRGWLRVMPLLMGLYFPLQLPLQFLFFLNGRDSAPGPNTLLLGGWGLLWLLFGFGLYSYKRLTQEVDMRTSVRVANQEMFKRF